MCVNVAFPCAHTTLLFFPLLSWSLLACFLPCFARGDCATCQITLAGRYTKPCVAKVPAAPKLKSLQDKGLEIRG